jgi:hypothetical protein
MNKLKFVLLIAAILSMPTLANARSVDVYEENYDGDNQVSFVVGQGDVETQVHSLFRQLYPDAQVLFKNPVKGFLLADVEIFGSNVDNVATDMLAGLGLSACYYANNVIEVDVYKKRGLCPLSKMSSGDRPKIKRYNDGIFSVTNEWFGEYTSQGLVASNTNGPDVIKASYTPPSASVSNASPKFPVRNVEFTMIPGSLAPQIRNLVLNLDNPPEVVWELDENTQWFNYSVIRRGTYIEILADILDSYNAFADIYENNVIVVRNSDFQ